MPEAVFTPFFWGGAIPDSTQGSLLAMEIAIGRFRVP